jgi:uncharacterized protein (TIGR02186 family)
VLRLLALVVLLAFPLPLVAQESVVTGVSTDNISLNANFDGSELFVFGAVRRDAPPPTDMGPLDVIITVKGPPRSVKVRRKDRRFGIWVNNATLVVRAVPSFYAVASTRPVSDLLGDTERLRYGIGMDQAVRRVGGNDSIDDVTPFTDAVIRIREHDGSYAILDAGVTIAEETLFQTRIEMPANLVEGDYAAEFFLVRDRQVISSAATIIRVEKTGIERWLYNLSRQQPLVYGLMSVGLALLAGWLANAAFRFARR